MDLKSQSRRLAKSHTEIEPLVELCKRGKLFEVQTWIAENKPVNPPVPRNGRDRKFTPLKYAIDRGFHSLVKVLLEGGASIGSEYGYSPISLPLTNRRLDIVQLLVEYGFPASRIDMDEVFESWDPEIMEYFIEQGADVETGMPLATALCNRIRTALRIFKKYQGRFPSFQEQANIALRHHCKEGNQKWISLLIWAGADPLAPGEAEPGQEIDPEGGGLSALGFATLYGHEEVLTMKQIKIPPDHPAVFDILRYCSEDESFELIESLLKKGMQPNDQSNGGCSGIQSLLTSLDFGTYLRYLTRDVPPDKYDTDTARNQMKMIHLLAKHGARWCPFDRSEINLARRTLLKMTPDYTMEFAWILSRYQACSKADLQTLLKTTSIRRHAGEHKDRLKELLENFPADQPQIQ